MRAEEMDLRELLDFEPQGGVIRFAGQRALILDAVALGLLRKGLIHMLGQAGARGVLTRFGYAHGWRTAETLKTEFPWDSEGDWRKAGGRLHTLQGMVVVEPVVRDPSQGPGPFAEGHWHDSYEAEQHLLHMGQSEEPVCWTLCGYASGYLSYVNGQEIYCMEVRCKGRGDAFCQMIGRTREEWGEELVPVLPFFHQNCLNQSLQRATDALKQTERQLRSRRHELARRFGVDEDPSGIMARSEPMRRVLDVARRVAKVESTVLITGESGVGKERLARLIHDESPRADGPFVAINCGALPENLLESELFGHAKGSFTGATQDRPGLLESAGKGTIFLDEIGELTLSLQVKLLRALQEREVRRVGENKNRPIDVRVVAATNRDLAADVVAGRFRQDLYYRLRVIELHVPPLRERTADILPLARVLLAEAARRTNRKVTGFSPRAADQLQRYSWPGNVRELENALERAAVLATGPRIEVEDLPAEIGSAAAAVFSPGDGRSLDEVERDYILAVLDANGGNRTKAAAQLKIGPATLYRKLKQFGDRKPTDASRQ